PRRDDHARDGRRPIGGGGEPEDTDESHRPLEAANARGGAAARSWPRGHTVVVGSWCGGHRGGGGGRALALWSVADARLAGSAGVGGHHPSRGGARSGRNDGGASGASGGDTR